MGDPLTLSSSPTLQDSVSIRLVYAWLCQQGTECRLQGWRKFFVLRPLGFLPASCYCECHFNDTVSHQQQQLNPVWIIERSLDQPHCLPTPPYWSKAALGHSSSPLRNLIFRFKKPLLWAEMLPPVAHLHSPWGPSPVGFLLHTQVISWPALPLHWSGFQLHGASPCPQYLTIPTSPWSKKCFLQLFHHNTFVFPFAFFTYLCSTFNSS